MPAKIDIHDKADHTDIMRLTIKQREFCQQFLILDENATEAYQKVFKCNRKCAQEGSSRLLARSNIQQVIKIFRDDMQLHLQKPHHKRLAEINSDIEAARKKGIYSAVSALHAVRERMLGNRRIHNFNLADGETMTDKINMLYTHFSAGHLSCDEFCAIMNAIKTCEIERLNEEIEVIMSRLNDKIDHQKVRVTR